MYYEKIFILMMLLFAYGKMMAYDGFMTEYDGITLYVDILSNNTVSVTYSMTADVKRKVFTVPSTLTYDGITYTVTEIGEMEHFYCQKFIIPGTIQKMGHGVSGQIDTLIIESGVTTISEDAFTPFNSTTGYSYTRDISVVILPDGLKTVEDRAFLGCNSLTQVNIPNSVTKIGTYAFCECESLTEVTIGDGVKTIEEQAFADCPLLAKVTIGKGVETIEKEAFQNSGLESIVVPRNVKYIGNSAFEECHNLSSVILEDGIEYIRAAVFYNCKSLTSVIIPGSVQEVGGSAFQGCTYLTSVVFEEGTNRQIGVQCFLGCPILNSVKILKSESTKIWESAFENCKSLTELVLEEGVDSLGYAVFYGCDSLTHVDLPKGVKTIGKSAFYDCRSLTELTIGDGAQTIKNNAFYNCPLTKLTIGDGVETIGERAFTYSFVDTLHCHDSVLFIVPESVYSIGEDAFLGCTIFYAGTATENYPWGATVYTDMDENFIYTGTKIVKYIGKGGNVVIPNGVTEIGEAFYGCTGLTSVTIPNSVTIIGSEAFRGCTGLSSVNVPNSVTEIGDWAFEECTGLSSVTIPNSVTIIGRGAFGRCKGLSSVTVPNSVTIIGSEAFWGCTGLSSVTIPNSVTEIDDDAFYNVKNIEYHGSATGSPWGALTVNGIIDGDFIFSDVEKSKLTAYIGEGGVVTIPDGVTEIGDYAFDWCRNLTSVTISNNIIKIGERAFYATRLTSVIVPSSITEMGYEAFGALLDLSFTCMATTPPSYDIWSYDGYYSSWTVYVPDDVVSAYKSAPVWEEFNIKGLSEKVVPSKLSESTNATTVAIVGNQILVNGEAPAFVVTISGKKIANANLKAGVYFVVVDGNSVSVVVR